MKIITGSSKAVQGTGETQSATVSYEFGVKGSEQKRVRDRSIVQGTVLHNIHRVLQVSALKIQSDHRDDAKLLHRKSSSASGKASIVVNNC